MLRLPLMLLVLLPACALLFACGGDDAAPAPTATAVPTALTIVNETPCVLHFRFDNGFPKGRVQPGATIQYEEEGLAAYRFVKFESTRAIFRTFDLGPIRDAGSRVVVTSAVEDGPCAEPPG